MAKLKPSDAEAARARYYPDARSWAEDRQLSAQRSQKLAWSIAGVAVLVACLEAFALAALAPLKRVEPYTLLVDRQTGYTRILKGDGVEQITADEALTQSLLAQYVIARESFDITTIGQEYRKVGLWSAETARSGYVATMQTDNPASPFRRLPRTSLVTTRIKSVSQLGRRTALVRFETARLDQGQVEANWAPWVAVVHYRFARAPMSLDDLLLNPLGFQVTQYRRDQEAVATDSPAPVVTVAGTTGAGTVATPAVAADSTRPPR